MTSFESNLTIIQQFAKKNAIESHRGTLQGLKDYFVMMNQVKITFTGTEIGIPGIDEWNPMSQRIFSGILDISEVRLSQIHDRGVFAKRDIKKGELITFYPGDGIGFKMGDNRGIFIFKKNFDMRFYTESFLDNYRFNISEQYYIVGNPNDVLDNAYIGHIINDSSKLTKGNNIDEYLVESISKCNAGAVLIENCHVAIISLRDIVKDEELFISYGPKYWKSRM